MYFTISFPVESYFPDKNGRTNATDVRSIFADISNPTYTLIPFVSTGSLSTWQAFHFAMSMYPFSCACTHMFRHFVRNEVICSGCSLAIL